jgi:Tfp pilus assembly protein FimT
VCSPFPERHGSRHPARGDRLTRASAGYTALEIVIVLSLVGLLLGMAVHGVRDALAREEIDGQVRAIVHELTAAQQTALTRRHRVLASFQGQTYTIVDQDGGGVVRSETVPDHITFGDTLRAVQFDRRGVPGDAGGSALSEAFVLVVSSTASGRTYTVHVEPVTGRVSYREP